MMRIFVSVFLFCVGNFGNAEGLNLPEKFVAKIIDGEYSYENGTHGKISKYEQKKECSFFHFEKGRFFNECVSHQEYHYHRVLIKYHNKRQGTYTSNGSITGIWSQYNRNWFTDSANCEYLRYTNQGRITGKINSDLMITIIEHYGPNNEKIYDRNMEDENGKHICLNGWKLRKQKPQIGKIIYHLKIVSNGSENNLKSNSNTGAPTKLPEEDFILSQPSDALSVDMEASTSPTVTVANSSTPPKPKDPCKDPDFKGDPAWKEYCANKAANAKAEAEYEKAKAEEEAEYQRKLAEYEKKKAQWNEEKASQRESEDRRIGREREAWRERQKTRDQQEREALRRDTDEIRSFYKELDKSIQLVSRFGGDEKDREYRRIEKLSKEGVNVQRAKRLHHALRTKHYDSRQAALETESAYQSEREKALESSQAYVEKIRDTSVTVNKVLAKMAPGDIGDDIVEIQETIINAIDNYGKGGAKHSLYGAVRDKIGGEATKFSSDYLDNTLRRERFHTTGIEIPDDIAAYDALGQRVKRFKSGDRLYDKAGHRIDQGLEKKLLRYRSWTTQADRDLKQGDFNKKFGAVHDAYDTGEKIGKFIGKIIWK